MSSLFIASRGLYCNVRAQSNPVSWSQGPGGYIPAPPTAPLRLWTAGRHRLMGTAAAVRSPGTGGAEGETPSVQKVRRSMAPTAGKKAADAADNSAPVGGPSTVDDSVKEARVQALADLFGIPLELAKQAVASSKSITMKRPEKIAADVTVMRTVLAGSANAAWREWGAATVTTVGQLTDRARVSPAAIDRLRQLIALGVDTAFESPRRVLRWLREAWEEWQDKIEEYGTKGGVQRLATESPKAFEQPLDKHRKLIATLQKTLGLPRKSDAVRVILSRPAMLTYPLSLIESRLDQLLRQTRSVAATCAMVQSNPDLLFQSEEKADGGDSSNMDLATDVSTTQAYPRHKSKAPASYAATAAVLGVSEERLHRALSNSGSGIASYDPALLEERIQGLMQLFDCPREVVTTAAVIKPSIITSETKAIAEKVEAIKAALSRSNNDAWRAWGEAPVTTDHALRAWAAWSLQRISRLGRLVDEGQDVTAQMPAPVLKLSARQFKERYGWSE